MGKEAPVKAPLFLLYLYLKSVVSKRYAFRQNHLGMRRHVVAHVREERTPGAHPLRQRHSLLETHVRHVLLRPQGVNHESVHTLQQPHGAFRHLLGIRYISEPPDAESDNRQPIVHNGQRHHFLSGGEKRTIAVDAAHPERRHTGIRMPGEAVGQPRAQVVLHIFRAVYVEVMSVPAPGAQVVNASHVVVVDVCEQHGVNIGRTGPQHLLAKVRTAVYQQRPAAAGLYQCRTAQPLVARVGRSTRRAAASQLRDSRRCACAEKSQFHNLYPASAPSSNIRYIPSP